MRYRLSESAEAVILAPEPLRGSGSGTGSGSASASVVWLHGLGADGHDFAPIVPQLRLPESLALRFVFPHAPRRAVTINQGLSMRAWYDIRTLGEGMVEDEAGIAESTALVNGLLEREHALGIPYRQIVLAGFSQGGAMALHAGLRAAEGLAGIMGLSTYLPLHEQLEAQAGAANRGTPVLLCHGLHDTVLPLQLGELARDTLRGLGYTVQWQAYPMAHEVCAAEIEHVAAWLARVLA
jgi:phospholipase/carboxylesterase